jgi:N-acetylmuramoyl-L-alanine amidase
MRAFVSVGHGGQPGGAIDPGHTTGPVHEFDLCREIVETAALTTLLVPVIMVPMNRLRGKIAWVNRWSRPGDVAIEVHLNAHANEAAHGCEVFFASDRGRKIAAEIHASLVRIGRSPRGVKIDSASQWSRLAWCRETKPWAVLVEVAFLSNDGERAWLLSGGTIEAGKAIASAIDKLP